MVSVDPTKEIYVTAGDDKVRPEHAVLNGITLPPSDPFWDKFLPPNDWNCRCTAVQVRANKYPLSDPEESMRQGMLATDGPKKAIFRYNPGKSLQIFPPKHPYYKAPKDAKEVIEQVTREAIREKRVRDMVEELPDSLMPDEKQAIAAHNLEIEKAFGITKGAAMSYDEANKGKENPNFAKGGGYRVNCQTCTVTHQLRRLGFDVEAKPNINNSAYEELETQGITWKQRFTNIDGSDVDYDMTYQWQRKKGYKTMTAKRLNEYLSEKLNHDGTYEIYCAWKNGDAHVFCAEVTDGKARFFDPQSGRDDVKYYLPDMKPGMVGVLRVDNKLVNSKLKNLFISK